MQAIHLLLLTMLAAALGEPETKPSSTQLSSSDYAYTNYALQFLGLGDNTQPPSSASGTKYPVTYTEPDQQGYVKYITYTSDGSNVYQVTVRMKPGSYPVISSTPVQSEPAAGSDKNKGENNADSNVDSKHSHSNNDNHPSALHPMTLPNHPEGHESHEVTTCHYENSNDESTERPAAVESRENENQKADGNDASNKQDKKVSASNILPRGYESYISPSADSRPQPQYFINSIYGPMSIYPVAYNPFTGQTKYVARPVGALPNANQPSTSPAQGDNGGQAAAITTLKPIAISSTIRPIPVGITTSGAPVQQVQPVSYVYPYMTYQSKNSGVLYQVPAQPINASPPQVIQWIQRQPSRFPAAYPQGYMSYQPAVRAMRSALPLSQDNQPKLSVAPTMHNVQTAGQK